MGGAFGVGGAIVTTPAVQVLLGARPIIAVGTPLPVIFPTTLSGMQAYRRAGQIDHRAGGGGAPPGAAGGPGGAPRTGGGGGRFPLRAPAWPLAGPGARGGTAWAGGR